MKKMFSLILMLFLMACDDSSSSTSVPEENDESSSSLTEKNNGPNSLDSEEMKSCSSFQKSSSSVSSSEESSSSEKLLSSSTMVESSDSEGDVVLSSSSFGEISSETIISSESIQSSSSEIYSSSIVQSSSSKALSSSSLFKDSWDFLNESLSYGEIVDIRDSQIYKTIVIGEQEWMAENLNYYDENDAVLKTNSWCYKEDNYNCRKNLTCKDSCSKYGRYYTWAAAIDSVGLGRKCGYNGGVCTFSGIVKGICPDGWHLPDTTEWTQLKIASKSSMALQSVGFEKWDKATNESGFSMIPSGYYESPASKYESGTFSQMGVYAFYWTASDALKEIAWYAMGVSNFFGLSKSSGVYEKKDGFSIRCVKD